MTDMPVVRFLDRSTPPHIFTLVMLSGISALNMSIFLPSLNHMAEYFTVDYAVMQFAVSGYLLATALLQVVIGPVSDRFGRRSVVIWALALFLLATLGCLFAPTAGVFLFFRMLQASVAVGIVLSRAIVRDMVPQDQAASMIGYVTMGMALIPMVGPMIGGALDQAFGWQASFVFLSVVGAGVLALVVADQGETIAGGGVGFGEQLRGYPVLLTSPRFWGYAMCAAFGSGAFFALLGGASFIAGEVFSLSPLWTGVALGSPAVGYTLGNFLSGRWSVRVGVNRMALAGSLVAAGGLLVALLVSLAGVQHPLVFFGFCTFLGLGNGMMLPSATAGLLSVRPQLAGTASGLGGAIMIGGGAAMAAATGAFLTVETGPVVLQSIMFLSSALGGVAILLVMWRARAIGVE
jgi:DHA1 family bicyclomycin/chloramphenicol resistance-like MFS transporter